MPKYSSGQFAKFDGEWYEIETLRIPMFGGKTEYLLKNDNRTGWVGEDSIQQVSNGSKEIH